MTGRQWFPPLIWAGVILVGTSIPGSDLPLAPDGLDKVVHLILYGVLGFLVARAMRGTRPAWVPAAMGLMACAVFGAADELHQQLIPGRSTEAADWAADAAGGAAGAAIASVLARRSRALTRS